MDLENTQVNEQEEVTEASTAQASLKPKASKSEMLAQMLRVIGGMKKEDLSAFLAKTLAQVGKEDDTVPDTSSKNQSSIATTNPAAPGPKSVAPINSFGAMKEDMDELLADSQDLSEEFKERATTLFEAAVNNRVSLEVARLEEEFEEKVEEQVFESVEKLNEQVSQYIDYVAEKWMEENEVALETNYRSSVTESFIEGLKKLFEESYVEVPEDKIDLIEELESKVEHLQESLETIEAENVRLNKVIKEDNIDDIFNDISEGLADTQVEKFRSLVEGIEFESAEEYQRKLEIIKEQYFMESTSEYSATGLINEEETVGSNEEPENNAYIPEEMKYYVQAISKTIKR